MILIQHDFLKIPYPARKSSPFHPWYQQEPQCCHLTVAELLWCLQAHFSVTVEKPHLHRVQAFLLVNLALVGWGRAWVCWSAQFVAFCHTLDGWSLQNFLQCNLYYHKIMAVQGTTKVLSDSPGSGVICQASIFLSWVTRRTSSIWWNKLDTLYVGSVWCSSKLQASNSQQQLSRRAWCFFLIFISPCVPFHVCGKKPNPVPYLGMKVGLICLWNPRQLYFHLIFVISFQ